MMTYDKVLRNLKMEHQEKMEKRQHPKLCRKKPCQDAWLIAFLEAHPPTVETEESIPLMIEIS